MMPCVLPNMKLELSWNWKKSAVLTLISSPPTSSKTYPYPKGEHNGAVGPKYASMINSYTARPRDTRILVPEKNRAAQNRASWGLYLCTKWDFFYKNRVSSRLLFKIRASWGYTYVLKGIFIDFFLAYLAIGTFFNWDLWTIETFKQLGIGMFMQLGPLAIGTFGQLEIVGSS